MRFFIRLDFPLPEPPRITTISPGRTSKDALSSNTREPYPILRFRTLTADDDSACGERSIQLVTTAKRPSITMIMTMLDTTAPVAERPTEAAPAPVLRPRWQ